LSRLWVYLSSQGGLDAFARRHAIQKLSAIRLIQTDLNVCTELSELPVLYCICFEQQAKPFADDLTRAGIEAAFDLLGDAAFEFGSQGYLPRDDQ
jgi:hypothetical protein